MTLPRRRARSGSPRPARKGTGRTSVTYLIQTRSADGGAWRDVDVASSRPRAVEAMLGIEGLARLYTGDLARVVTEKGTLALAVMTEEGMAPAPPVPPKSKATTWLDLWEGPGANAATMLRLCETVDRRLLALATCACVRTVLSFVPRGENRPRLAIEAVEAWARGEVSLEVVKKASDATYAYSVSVYTATSPAYYAAVAAVARSAYSAAVVAYSARTAPASAPAAAAYSAVASLPAYSPDTPMFPSLVREFIPLSVFLLSKLRQRP